MSNVTNSLLVCCCMSLLVLSCSWVQHLDEGGRRWRPQHCCGGTQQGWNCLWGPQGRLQWSVLHRAGAWWEHRSREFVSPNDSFFFRLSCWRHFGFVFSCLWLFSFCRLSHLNSFLHQEITRFPSVSTTSTSPTAPSSSRWPRRRTTPVASLLPVFRWGSETHTHVRVRHATYARPQCSVSNAPATRRWLDLLWTGQPVKYCRMSDRSRGHEHVELLTVGWTTACLGSRPSQLISTCYCIVRQHQGPVEYY